MDEKKCPACDSIVKPLQVQPPLETLTTDTQLTSQSLNYSFPNTAGIEYAPRSKIYKCSNDTCWVTKITISWE